MGPVHIRRRNNRTYIVFDRHLEIAQAAQLHAGLRQALTTDASLVVNAGRVERIDTAAVQVLATFCRTAHARGVAVKVGAVSEPVNAAIALLGVPAFWENAA